MASDFAIKGYKTILLASNSNPYYKNCPYLIFLGIGRVGSKKVFKVQNLSMTHTIAAVNI